MRGRSISLDKQTIQVLEDIELTIEWPEGASSLQMLRLMRKDTGTARSFYNGVLPIQPRPRYGCIPKGTGRTYCMSPRYQYGSTGAFPTIARCRQVPTRGV